MSATHDQPGPDRPDNRSRPAAGRVNACCRPYTVRYVTEDKQDADAKVDKRLVDAAALLLVEIDVILSSNRWAVISNGSADTRHRLYDAAALRHVAALLRDLA